MKNPFLFFSELFKRPAYEIAWVFYMMFINLASLLYWEYLLSKIIFVVFMISSMLMMGLFSKFGFTKILGLGHILWLPLVAWIIYELPRYDGSYFIYLIALTVTISISLVIDIYDVWSYFKNPPERETVHAGASK
ncbi:MAG: hypothetical protein ACFCU6_13870 [Balneolaceae bacterium]